MKKITGLSLMGICVLLFTAFVAIQNEIQWGEMAVGDKGGQSLTLLGSNDTELFYLRSNKKFLQEKQYFLETFSKSNLSRTKSNPVIFPDSTKKFEIENYAVAGRNIYMFMSHFDKSGKTNSLYLYRIDASGKFQNSATLEKIQEEKRKSRSYFSIATSKDGSKLLVYSDGNKKGSDEELNLQLFNADLVPLWSKNLRLPYKDDAMGLAKVQIDNRGDVFMLISVVATEGSKKDRLISKTWSLIQYNNQDDDYREFDMKLKNKFISEVNFEQNEAGDLVASGFYSSQPGYGYGGVFYMLLDRETRDVESTSVQDFSPSFIAEFIGEKKAAKGRELTNYEMRNLIVKEDGGAYMVAEYYRMVEVCRTDPKTGATSCSYHYHYNDIIVANFDSNGEVKWVKRVPKLQHTVNDGGWASGVYSQKTSDGLSLVYNTEPKNINPKKPGKIYTMKRPNKAFLLIHRISENGVENQEIVVKNKEQKMVLAPDHMDYLSDGNALVYDFKKAEYRLGRLSLN